MRKRSWIIRGLIFGILLFVFIELLFPLLWKHGIESANKLIIKAIVWLFVGLLWGLLVKYINGSKNK